MDIDTAIKYSIRVSGRLRVEFRNLDADAVDMGVEGLKRIKRQRSDLEPAERKLLPGETKD